MRGYNATTQGRIQWRFSKGPLAYTIANYITRFADERIRPNNWTVDRVYDIFLVKMQIYTIEWKYSVSKNSECTVFPRYQSNAVDWCPS